MNSIWGILMIIIGAFFSICGIRKSNFLIYRLFVSRSKILWGEKVHNFYSVVGILIIIFGILFILGIFNQ